MKTIYSASRRTDMPAYYPSLICEKVQEIGFENIHTLVLWTKDPRNLLRHRGLKELITSLDQVYLHLTVTGLGRTALEPYVPDTERVFCLLPEVIKLLGTPERICLRYDPLLDLRVRKNQRISNIDEKMFQTVVSRTSELAIRRMMTSYFTEYRKVTNRFNKLQWQVVEHPIDEIIEFIKIKMIPAAESNRIRLETCVYPKITSDGGCIDGKLLTELHPKNETCSSAKDPTQRKDCQCTRSIELGQYHNCASGCVYCYANPVVNQD